MPDLVWSRIERTLARRMRLRAAAMAAVLAAVAAVPFLLAPPPPTQTAPKMADAAVADEAAAESLRALDRELQAAYDRNASNAEIALLWQVRRAMAGGDPDAPRPLRI